MKAILVINEHHSVLPEQVRVLSVYDLVEEERIPSKGLNRQEQKDLYEFLRHVMVQGHQVVFLSPIPAVMMWLAWEAGALTVEGAGGEYQPLVFANDRREKKELANGRVISVTAKEGWYLA